MRRTIASMLLGVAVAVSGSTTVGAQAREVQELRLDPSSGGATTAFLVDLPAGASCPGDSANDGYRVNTYLVPASLEPHEIIFDGLGPQPNALGDHGSFRQPLYDVETSPVASVITAEADHPGEPGLILDLPPFDFAVYGDGDLPAGTYNLGVVCTLVNEVERVWGTQLTISGSGPDDLRWTVTGAQLDDDASPLPLAAVPLVAGALTLLFLAWRWRRADRPTPTEPH